MDRHELQKLAQKQLDGTATSEEKALLNQWYSAVNDGELTEFVSIDTDETEADIKKRIFNNIQDGINPERQKIAAAKKKALIRKVAYSVAAAAVVLIVAGITWNIRGASDKAPGQMEYVTAPRVMKLMLPDGSSVWLNAHTEFAYPNKFAGKTRQVQLIEGRAFFDVKHEDAHPFIVKTRNMNITVLGTSFDVRTYGKEGTTNVSVVSGKVGITLPGRSDVPAVMLAPKQQVVLSKLNNRLTKRPVHEAAINLWCKSPLVFDQENLDNVFKAIEKQYNTHIQVADKALLNEQISITLSNQRLDTIMEILSFTKHFNYQIANDSTVMIK